METNEILLEILNYLKKLDSRSALPYVENDIKNKIPIFNEVFHTWFDTVKRPRLKKVTIDSYLYTYQKHIEGRFGYIPINEIKVQELQSFFNRKGIESTRKSEDIRSLLKGTFEFAVYQGYIDKNPMTYICVKKHFRQNGSAFTLDEEKALLKAIKGTRHELPIKLYLYTGVRPSELISLKFDFDKNVFIVKNSKLKDYQKNLEREVPIFPTLLGLKDDINTKNWRISYDRIKKVFHRYCINHSIKDLRHTFTSKARECGVENELVNIWTGHSPGNNMTANVYTHWSYDYQQNESKKIIH